MLYPEIMQNDKCKVKVKPTKIKLDKLLYKKYYILLWIKITKKIF